MAEARFTPELEKELIHDMAQYSTDPLGWVYYSFPWGEGALAGHEGPDKWQIDILKALRDGLLTLNEAIQIAVASGHGIGKSALVSWLILWSLSTFTDTKGVVTANTSTQLKTKTWAELAKWFPLFIARHWFDLEATSIHAKDPAHEKTWRIDAVPWSKNNTEAFAGLHNQGKRIVIIFDEASAIDDVIWQVSEGALTDKDTEIVWVAFGNPTRNTGRFADCFGINRHRWIHKSIDSRDARMTNKEQIDKWIEDYGEDSDFVKVRVRGIFPSSSALQVIPLDLVERALARGKTIQPMEYNFAPKIIGVDVARYGDDSSCISLRQGLKGDVIWRGRNIDTMSLADVVASLEDKYKADAVFIDVGNMGAGVIDRLRQLGRSPIEIAFSMRPMDARYLNKRAEIWWRMKEWLDAGGALPTHDVSANNIREDLIADLTAPEYYFTPNGKKVLESKEDMKKRGLPSPDKGDSLALTFASPVLPKQEQREVKQDFDLFTW